MDNLKLISVRIDSDTLAKIDALAKQNTYYCRNTIINNLLTAVVTCADSLTLSRMYKTSRPRDIGYKVDFIVDNKNSG